MKAFLNFGVAVAMAATGVAVAQQVIEVKDPANLTGEHVSPQSPADTLPINHGAAALQQLLLKLRTRASMMLIVAHPDDEDGGLLTYESRGQGVRVAMLTLNRGEGGQNLMSGDFNDALGLIRTQELLAADRYMGVNQMFGTEIDFGFSKTKEETFEKWTHERVLYDAVRAVRLYRPLVLASVFVGGPTDGHGHHQVAGEITQEVFKAAADPKVFPEMIKEGLLPWAPLKVYARVPFSRVTRDGMFDYATGKTIPTRFQNYVTGVVTNTVPTATVTIHEGNPAIVMGKPALGMDGLTWVQFARKGLGLQKTQIGAGVRVPPAGAASDTGYTLMGSRLGSMPAKESSLFEGIDTSLAGIADLAPAAPPALRAELAYMDSKLDEAQKLFDPDHLDRVAEPLRQVMVFLDAQIKGAASSNLPAEQKANLLHELRVKRVQLNDALVLALGVSLKAELQSDPPRPDGSIVPGAGDKVDVQADGFAPGSSTPVKLAEVSVVGPESTLRVLRPEHAAATKNIDFSSGIDFPANTPYTRPYFSRPDIEQPFYDISNPNLRDAPMTPYPLVADAHFEFRDVPLEIKQAFVAEGTRNAISFVPAVSVALSPASGIVRPQEDFLALSAKVRSTQSVQALGGVMLYREDGRKPYGRLIERAAPEEMSKVIEKDEFVGFKIPTAELGKNPFVLRAVVTQAHKDYTQSFRAVGYPGLVYTNYFTPAIYRGTPVNVVTAPDLKVAYLPGTGDDVPEFLPDLGVKPVLITPKDLTEESLKQFDAVILGVRAYAAQSALAGKGSQPLLEYAKNGGVVIVQYETAKFGDAEAPYPISVPGDSAHNVVVESDPVKLLAPDAPLLTWPNKITPADFDHWVEERGHGFAATWAPQYQPLLETQDPDQDPQKGGLLVAPVGRGAYIYCALALYRQLPEGVPGAYRLFANLVSYAKNPHRY